MLPCVHPGIFACSHCTRGLEVNVRMSKLQALILILSS